MRRASPRAGSAITTVIGVACLSLASVGCSAPEDMVPLPGVKGSGDSGYDVRIEVPTAANLVEKSEVKVRDVTVGTVKRIGLDNWHAVVTVSLESGVELPRNSEARVGQKSLLGAEYLEIYAPAAGAEGRLRDGDLIPLSRGGNYPETEDLLTAVSALLNGGGLANISTIVRELNTAFDDPESATLVLHELAELATTLSAQRGDIERLITTGDALAASLARRSDDIGESLEDVSEGVAVLEKEKEDIVQALDAVDGLSRVGKRVISDNGTDVLADVRALARVTGKLAEAGEALPRSLDTVGTVLFPVSAIQDVVKGDYLNVAATIDVSLPALERGLFPSADGQELMNLLLTSLGILPTVNPSGSAAAVDQPTAPAPSPGWQSAVRPPANGQDRLGLGGVETPPLGVDPLVDSLSRLLGGRR